MINRVVLIGRLTKDPELKKTQNGISTLSFTLACDRGHAKEGEQKADFPQCQAWRKTAEYLAEYAEKGTMVAVEGRIQTRNYDDRDGKRVFVTEVLADSVQILSYKNKNTESSNDEYLRGGGYSLYQKDITEETLIDPEDDLPF